MCRMGSLPSVSHWRITFNKKILLFGTHDLFHGCFFMCIFLYSTYYIIENELNINIFLLYLFL